MNKKIRISIYFFFLINICALAQVPHLELNKLDLEVYHYHLNRCQEYSHSPIVSMLSGFDWETAKESAKESFFFLIGDEEKINLLFKNQGRSIKLKKDLESLGYYYALNDCFAENELLKNAYTVGFILSDSFGKISLLLPLSITTKIIGKTLSLLPSRYKLLLSSAATVSYVWFLTEKIYDEYRPRTQEEKEIFFDISSSLSHDVDEVLAQNKVFFEDLIEINKIVLDNENSSIEDKELAVKRIKLLNNHLLHFENE